MYIARFDLGGKELCQALVVAPDLTGGNAGIVGSNARSLTRLAGRFAIRTRVRDGHVERTWILNADSSRESDLVRELEHLVDVDRANLEIAVDKNWHDRVAAEFPAGHLMWMRSGDYRAGEYGLASGFRLSAVLDQFFECAARFDWDVFYQANVSRYADSQHDQRELRKQLARMKLDETFPRDLLAHQQSIFVRAAEPGYLVDEFIGSAEAQAADYLRQIVEDEFAVRLHRYNFASSPLEDLPDDLQDDALVTGFQSETLEETNPVVRAASAATPSDVDDVQAWMPRIDVVRLSSSAASGDDEPTDVFISYSSRDLESAARVCEFLENAGMRCWIAPRNIRAGASYPAEIVKGLQRCRSLVLLFSEHSNVSPHVQREVERVVTRAIPIVTLKLQDVPMTDTMEYLISTPHSLMAHDPPTDDDLQRLCDDMHAHLR